MIRRDVRSVGPVATRGANDLDIAYKALSLSESQISGPY